MAFRDDMEALQARYDALEQEHAKLKEELEEHLHMRCLFALSRHAELPDWMRTEGGEPLFPTNLNPAQDLEKWRDAVEVAWEVMEEELSVTHDEVHHRLADEQGADWERFLESVAKRKRERGESGD